MDNQQGTTVYSTGNSAQCYVAAWMGGEFGGEWKHVYVIEYYLAIKKNEIMPFAATWMDLEIIILSEVKNKYHMITFMCRI